MCFVYSMGNGYVDRRGNGAYHCLGRLLGNSKSREGNEEGGLEVHCECSVTLYSRGLLWSGMDMGIGYQVE